ncbi:MAG: type II toxin-antitoxin system PemK/MazF family toxin [Ornithinimicrobium sp.]|uniref:type II toxin-antitoxin system PemK/MazF family toxin n=1 Tax=Ornithinimicrobium sp. TaxID=1977084 RepID=UPI003D9B96E7
MPARAEVWWCEPPDIGRRPVVVLSRDAAIERRRRTLVAPCTTTLRGLPSEVELSPTSTPSRDSVWRAWTPSKVCRPPSWSNGSAA